MGTYTRPISRRALLAADGKTLNYDGQERDARYAFKTETLREWLGDLITSAIESQLRVLLPREQLDKREQARQKARNRAQEGRYKQDRVAYFATAQDRRAEAIGLKKQGLFVRAISGQLRLSKSQVPAWLRVPCPPLLYSPCR